MQLFHKYSLETVIIIVTSFWHGHMCEWKKILVENICWKVENSNENGDDEKRGRKT
jgi:G:T-mismatch repair DNA endonuclease (very short patch repair protein)